MNLMISFLLSIIVFLINGVVVLRFYQIKDYLYKRIIAHFYFPSSKKLIFNKKEYFLYFLFFIFIVLTFFYDFQNFWHLDALIFLVILFFVLRFNLLKKIHFTPKAIIVSFLALIFNFVLLIANNNHPALFLLLSTCIWQFIIFTLSIKVFDICVKPYLNYLGKKTKEKIEKIKKENPDFKIIGIVGSYGKSSTKEFLVQLLKEKYKVLATPPRINHEYALLKFLLNVKIKNYDFLVIEFGSYYLGNIKWTTQFITPDIAYITGITKQHLFLFGSIENIIIGEGTEILSWMKEGILFVNKNHQYFEKLQEKIKVIADPKIKIYTYGFSADFSYKILENNLERCVFDFNKYTFETKIIFPMQIENLCGSLAYISLVDDLENYQEKIKNLELPEGFLKLKIKNNLYIFDDSYNANPKGVFDSLKFFQSLDFDYKIVIFNGLLELGQETKEIYQELAKEFLAFDKIIVTSADFQNIFKEILKDKFLPIERKKELELFLQSLKQPRVGIWIFNRFPEKVKINL